MPLDRLVMFSKKKSGVDVVKYIQTMKASMEPVRELAQGHEKEQKDL